MNMEDYFNELIKDFDEGHGFLYSMFEEEQKKEEYRRKLKDNDYFLLAANIDAFTEEMIKKGMSEFSTRDYDDLYFPKKWDMKTINRFQLDVVLETIEMIIDDESCVNPEWFLQYRSTFDICGKTITYERFYGQGEVIRYIYLNKE